MTGRGYLASYSVVAAGTSPGYIYDAATTGPDGIVDSARLVAVLKDEGVYRVGCRFSRGLVFVPGADQAASITWSLD